MRKHRHTDAHKIQQVKLIKLLIQIQKLQDTCTLYQKLHAEPTIALYRPCYELLSDLIVAI